MPLDENIDNRPILPFGRIPPFGNVNLNSLYWMGTKEILGCDTIQSSLSHLKGSHEPRAGRRVHSKRNVLSNTKVPWIWDELRKNSDMPIFLISVFRISHQHELELYLFDRRYSTVYFFRQITDEPIHEVAKAETSE